MPDPHETQFLDERTARRLVAVEQKLAEAVAEGEHPTTALTKLAIENDLTDEMTRRVAEIYNQSSSLAMFEDVTPDKRAELFDLADANSALVSVKEAREGGAGSRQERESLAWQPTGRVAWRKTASSPLVVEQPKKKHADWRAASEEALLSAKTATAARIEAEQKYLELVNDLALARREGLKWASVDRAGGQLTHGDPAEREIRAAIKAAAESAGMEVVGDDYLHDPSRLTFLDTSVGGLRTVEGFVQAALQHRRKLAQLHKSAKKAIKVAHEVGVSEYDLKKEARCWEGYEPVPGKEPYTEGSCQPKKDKDSDEETGEEKAAAEKAGVGILDFFKSVGGDDARTRAGIPAAKNRALAEAMRLYENPDTRDRRRQIRIQTMLADFMANDEVISTYEPDEIVDMFNEIAEIAPEVVDKTSIMRGLLQRSLTSGQVQPFEVSQILGLAKDTIKNEQLDRDFSVENAGSFESERGDLSFMGPGIGRRNILKRKPPSLDELLGPPQTRDEAVRRALAANQAQRPQSRQQDKPRSERPQPSPSPKRPAEPTPRDADSKKPEPKKTAPSKPTPPPPSREKEYDDTATIVGPLPNTVWTGSSPEQFIAGNDDLWGYTK